MSEWLSTMSSLELAEELIIVVKHNATGKLLTLGGYREGRGHLSESDILVLKQKQVTRMLDYYSSVGAEHETGILSQIGGINDIVPINLNQFVCGNMTDERADQVFTFQNYQVKDHCSGYVYFDKANNTLEYREVFDLTLPGLSLYAIIPGEYFEINPTTKVVNDTQILTRSELLSGLRSKKIDFVPTLKAYVAGVEANKVLNFFQKAV
jgi:hypothetical protein